MPNLPDLLDKLRSKIGMAEQHVREQQIDKAYQSFSDADDALNEIERLVLPLPAATR